MNACIVFMSAFNERVNEDKYCIFSPPVSMFSFLTSTIEQYYDHIVMARKSVQNRRMDMGGGGVAIILP